MNQTVTQPITLLLVDDSELVRTGLRSLRFGRRPIDRAENWGCPR